MSTTAGSARVKDVETKTMGMARYRNRVEERCLGRRLEVLGRALSGRCRQLRVEMGQLEEHLHAMNPLARKPLVCPKGLTENEKEEYRKLRRHSYTPSMTLREFDVRLTDFRHAVTAHRRRSLRTNLEEAVLPDDAAGIVDLEEHEFCAPLTKHKHTMKEALKRATATDISTSHVPRSTEHSHQFASKTTNNSSQITPTTSQRPRVVSESSAITTASGSEEPVVSFTNSAHPTKDRPTNFQRSVSHPGHKKSSPQSTTDFTVSSALKKNVSRPSVRPLTAYPSSRAEQWRREDQLGSRSRPKSASARHQDARGSVGEILICPDYIIARRLSAAAGAGAAGGLESTKRQIVKG